MNTKESDLLGLRRGCVLSDVLISEGEDRSYWPNLFRYSVIASFDWSKGVASQDDASVDVDGYGFDGILGDSDENLKCGDVGNSRGGLQKSNFEAGDSGVKTLLDAPECGAALIQFYPPRILRGNGSLQGLISVGSDGFGRGASAAILSDTGELLIHLDDGDADLRQNTRINLANGVNRIFFAWNLRDGYVSFSLNGGVVKNFGPVMGWKKVASRRCVIGSQFTSGGRPREYEGVISSALVFGRGVRPPFTLDGMMSNYIRKITKTSSPQPNKPRSVRVLGDIYAESICHDPAALTVLGKSHVRTVARTGDHVAEGDAIAGKVRCEFGEPVGWPNTSTLYGRFRLLLPSMSLPGPWGLICQGRQGGSAPNMYRQPPFALILDRGVLEAVIRKNNPEDLEKPHYALRTELMVTAGKWSLIEFQQKWDAGAGHGLCRIWVDSQLSVNYRGPLGQKRSDRVRITMGVYRAEALDEVLGFSSRSFSAEFMDFRVSDTAFEGPWQYLR